MYGSSLTGCIRDIALKHMPLSMVDKIVCGTTFNSRKEYEAGLDRYCRTYWKSLDQRYCKVVGMYLWVCNKIVQPRLENPDYMPDASGNIWHNTLEDAMKPYEE